MAISRLTTGVDDFEISSAVWFAWFAECWAVCVHWAFSLTMAHPYDGFGGVWCHAGCNKRIIYCDKYILRRKFDVNESIQSILYKSFLCRCYACCNITEGTSLLIIIGLQWQASTYLLFEFVRHWYGKLWVYSYVWIWRYLAASSLPQVFYPWLAGCHSSRRTGYCDAALPLYRGHRVEILYTLYNMAHCHVRAWIRGKKALESSRRRIGPWMKSPNSIPGCGCYVIHYSVCILSDFSSWSPKVSRIPVIIKPRIRIAYFGRFVGIEWKSLTSSRCRSCLSIL